jgi:hypothetical protein
MAQGSLGWRDAAHWRKSFEMGPPAAMLASMLKMISRDYAMYQLYLYFYNLLILFFTHASYPSQQPNHHH